MLCFYNLFFYIKYPPLTPERCMKYPDEYRKTKLAVYGVRVIDKSDNEIVVKKGNVKFRVYGKMDKIEIGKHVSLKLMFLNGDVFRLLFVHVEKYRIHKIIVSGAVVLFVVILFFRNYTLKYSGYGIFLERNQDNT
ncbi:MAG: hypothetical protein A2161_15475 [Candidatus Schekmanbacteria bacterium RBG_13_48_7]|uniref:Uncharacterized protein n=1 Tax=Candidatus Schekmanbacteria bacterium RBG_13_48_7 TaxID=1817878 RepID=A0A1F7S3D8_9BACT|nr:MAG: hypothetical protein A2161_15475 [Candidatus Schekmanbacteria bacterium RBG_13_48_7]